MPTCTRWETAAVMALGHFVPVPANLEWNPDVLKLPIVHRYRRD